MLTSTESHVYLVGASRATGARGARRTVAPTPFGPRGGAVPNAGSPFARDSARTWMPVS